MARQTNVTEADLERQLHDAMRNALREDIRRTIRTLLETKQLYQGVKIDWSKTKAEAKRIQDNVKDASSHESITIGGETVWIKNGLQPYLLEYAQGFISSGWIFTPELRARISRLAESEDLDVIAPPAELWCRICKTSKTHNSGSLTIETLCPPYPLGTSNEQVFTCGYECQSCRTTPIVFQITRRGEKLTVTGSSEYPKVSVARDIPEEIEGYVSEAIIAAGTGRILAGLFFLRTAIEQHMRLATKLRGRQTGDELATAYFKLLDKEFPKRDWILGRVYEELSSKLHMAEADEKQFEKSIMELNRFFSILKLYPLTSNSA